MDCSNKCILKRLKEYDKICRKYVIEITCEVECMKNVNEIAQCPGCGAIFIKTPFAPICKTCQQTEQQEIEIVRGYIQDRGYATLDEIHLETGVRYNTLLKMFQRGTFVEYSCVTSYPCSSCGIMITQGISCSRCVEKLEIAARQACQEHRDNENRGVRMYSLEGKNK